MQLEEYRKRMQDRFHARPPPAQPVAQPPPARLPAPVSVPAAEFDEDERLAREIQAKEYSEMAPINAPDKYSPS